MVLKGLAADREGRDSWWRMREEDWGALVPTAYKHIGVFGVGRSASVVEVPGPPEGGRLDGNDQDEVNVDNEAEWIRVMPLNWIERAGSIACQPLMTMTVPGEERLFIRRPTSWKVHTLCLSFLGTGE